DSTKSGEGVTVLGVDLLLLPSHDVDSNTCTPRRQPLPDFTRRNAVGPQDETPKSGSPTPSRRVKRGFSGVGDCRVEVVGRRVPGRGVRGDLVAGADVLDLIAGPVAGAIGQAGEPDVRDASPLGVADLLAELVGRRRDLARNAA